MSYGSSNINLSNAASNIAERYANFNNKSDVKNPEFGQKLGNAKDAKTQMLAETVVKEDKAAFTAIKTAANAPKNEETRPDISGKPVSPQNTSTQEAQKFMTQLSTQKGSTADKNDQVGERRSKTDDQNSEHTNANGKSVLGFNEGVPRGKSQISNSWVNRRSNSDDDDEDENGRRRRRRKQAVFAPKPLSVIEGAKVSESQTQDMFVASGTTSIGSVRNKTVIDNLKEYDLGQVGSAIYNTVTANVDRKEKNGISISMQKNLYAQIVNGMENINDVLTPEYKSLVREIVQGSLKAAQESNLSQKDLVKMLVTGLMAMSPHDDDARIMAETIKSIVSEVIYGKINIGYNMKSASYSLGAALFTLSIYLKNYQSEIEFTKDLEHKLNTAFSEAIWKATGEVSNFSQVYAKANIEQFMTGRLEEEKSYQKNLVKGMILSPLKKVINS